MAHTDRLEGTVSSVKQESAGAQEIIVDCGGKKAAAVAYTGLTGMVRKGDRVLLNITAVRLGLGSGGRHFVMANLSRPADAAEEPGPAGGHIMKLRYTPLQCRVHSGEEEDSAQIGRAHV